MPVHAQRVIMGRVQLMAHAMHGLCIPMHFFYYLFPYSLSSLCIDMLCAPRPLCGQTPIKSTTLYFLYVSLKSARFIFLHIA